ncbi:MAG: hypothetical protein H0T41_02485 [Rhodobacteraceae bacterium]|nr:hypothetical protein [Paracoccaceae bacterium]
MTNTYTLHINAYTPQTIPMARLARYMQSFAALLGHERAVHFAELRDGSTGLVARVDFEDVPKVRAKLDQIVRGEGDGESRRARDEIDRLLADDNATGFIEGSNAKVIDFPGAARPRPQQYGPFNQEGSLDGLVVSVGGADATKHVQLRNGDIKYTGLETDLETARRLGKHLFEAVRVSGTGRWIREEDGAWTLKTFKVRDFVVLRDESLRKAVEGLRAVEGSDWKSMADPVATLKALRDGGNGPH